MKDKFEKLLFQRPKIRGTHGYVKPDNKDLSKDLKGEYKKNKGKNGKEKYYSYAPVKKFLLSRVGKCWDKVYAEMSEHFDSGTGRFLMDAIKFFIEFHTSFDEDGDICDSRGKKLVDYPRYRFPTFYIHPKNKTLERVKKTVKFQKRKKELGIIEYEKKFYYRYDGIWYEVDKKKPDEWLMVHRWDKVYSDSFYEGQSKNSLIEKYGEFVVCLVKKQVNSKMCKKLNEKVFNLQIG